MAKKRVLKSTGMIFALIIIAIVIGFLYGYLYDPFSSNNDDSKVAESESDEKPNSDISTTGIDDSNELTISKDTELVFERYYLKSGEVRTENRTPSIEEIGMTKEDIQEDFPKWVVDEFSRSRVLFKKDVDNYCPEYYVLKENIGFIALFQPNKDDDTLLLIKDTNISISWLDDNMKSKIQKGYVVKDKISAETILENIDS